MPITTPSVAPVWKGQRGEWLVFLQACLFLLVAFGPRTAPGLPAWPAVAGWLTSGAGLLLMIGGALWLVAAVARLGPNLTPLPYPKDEDTLVDTGAYAFVRHPMYCGGIWAAAGWALWIRGPLTLVYAITLFVFFDIKARREEGWLCAKFPAYVAYRRRVRKLIPLIY
jgi:protein-S-isoprenylcysteine O-methyltransferase Ste14